MRTCALLRLTEQPIPVLLSSVQLLRYGRPVETIFDLFGRKEDDMTYALGYVAARSLVSATR